MTSVYLVIFALVMKIGQAQGVDPCNPKHHTIINDHRRSPGYFSTSSSRRLCDNTLATGWYRFQINGTESDMPTSCAKVNACGTLAPLWLSVRNGALPEPGETVRASACVTWSRVSGRSNCCGFRYPVRVKNCLNFFVYRLRSTGGCDLAYCAEPPKVQCRSGQLYLRHKGVCKDYKVEITSPKVKILQGHRKSSLVCFYGINDRIVAMTTPTFYLIWYRDYNGLSTVLQSAFTTALNASLEIGKDVFPGEKVVCGVQSIHDKSEKFSDPFFLGIKFAKQSYFIRENRPSLTIRMTSSVPLSCDSTHENQCGINILLSLKPHGKAFPHIFVNKCLLHISSKGKCSSTVCYEEDITISMPPNIADYSNTLFTLRGAIIPLDDLTWAQSSIESTIKVFDFPSRMCHVTSGVHIISFMNRIYTLPSPGIFTLFHSSKDSLKVQIRVKDKCLEEAFLCICGLAIDFQGSYLVIDRCHSYNKTIHFYKSSHNDDMKILKDSGGQLITIILGQYLRARLNLFDYGITASLHISGFFTGRIKGMCGQLSAKFMETVNAINDLPKAAFSPELWRVDGSRSLFTMSRVSKKLSITQRRSDVTCDCMKSSSIVTCPKPAIPKIYLSFIDTEDINDYITELNPSELSKEHKIRNQHILSTKDASVLCQNNTFLSKIKNACVIVLKSKLQLVEDMCIKLAKEISLPLLVQIMLRLLENLCELGIQTKSINTSDELNLRRVFNCPEFCFDHGVCTRNGCKCSEEYIGRDCFQKAGNVNGSTSMTTPLAQQNLTWSSTVAQNASSGLSGGNNNASSVSPKANIVTSNNFADTLTSQPGAVTQASPTQTSKLFISTTNNPTTVSFYTSFEVTGLNNTAEFKSSGVIDSTRVTATVTSSKITRHFHNTLLNTTGLNDLISSATTIAPSSSTSSSSSMEHVNNFSSASIDNMKPTSPLPVDNLNITSSSTVDGDITTLIPSTSTTSLVSDQPMRFISCDRSTSNCNFVYLTLRNTQVYAVKCMLTLVKFQNDKWKMISVHVRSMLRYVSSTLVECLIPDKTIWSSKTWIYSVYKVQVVSSNNISLSSTYFASVDGRCQFCNRWKGCFLKKNTCFISGKCRISAENSKSDRCYVCHPDKSLYNWTRRKDIQKPLSIKADQPFIVNFGDNIKYRFHFTESKEKLRFITNNTQSSRIWNGVLRIRTSLIPRIGDPTVEYYKVIVNDKCGVKYSIVLKVVVNKCGCNNGGRCLRRVVFNQNMTDYTCRCSIQFKGSRCQIKRDPCSLRPCYPGVKCMNNNGTYKCGRCPFGFTGDGRECLPTCSSRPCYQGVKCTDIYQPKRGYRCESCPKFYSGNGIDCIRNTSVNACSEGVCFNSSTCINIDHYPGYKCAPCPQNYHGNGSVCKVSCSSKCLNGGHCGTDNHCVCRQDFEGEFCEKEKCSIRCLNGGSCHGRNLCRCASGYTGRYCQTAVCQPSCLNNGACVRPGVCYCPFGYFGRQCERVFCYPSCLNGGVCRRNNVCKCPQNYSGRRCQNPICNSACKNGGRCVMSNKCLCKSGWTGNSCETPLCHLGCMHSGVCVAPNRCACQKGYYGPNCQNARCYGRCSYRRICTVQNTYRCRYRRHLRLCQMRRP